MARKRDKEEKEAMPLSAGLDRYIIAPNREFFSDDDASAVGKRNFGTDINCFRAMED